MSQGRFSAEQKFNIILESLRGERSISEICRDYGIAQSLFYKWRDTPGDGMVEPSGGAGCESEAGPTDHA
ncbi:MAG: transposase [Calditrichaeota bacterium]|nr:transposase [Calditrichota bacterium]